MKIKELIEILKSHDENLSVGIGNVKDDSDEAIVPLTESAIAKVERFDEFENELTGEFFLAIGYECSVCKRAEEEGLVYRIG